MIFTVKNLLECFTKRNCFANQTEIRVEKEIKKKGDKQYVNWTGYNGLYIGWIDQKDIVR